MSRVSDESIAQLSARLRANPSDAAALQALKEQYRQARDYASLVNLLSGWANVATSYEQRADALCEAGQVLLEGCAAPDKAAPYFAQALSNVPEHEHALLGYQLSLEQTGQYQELAEFLVGRAQALHEGQADGPTQGLVCYQVGELCKDHLGHPDDALQWFTRAFELDPTILRAIYEARQIYLARGDVAAAAELLAREAEAEPDGVRRALLMQELADVRENDLQDLEGAVQAMRQACTEQRQDSELAVEYAQLLLRAAEGRPRMEADALREEAATIYTHLGLAQRGEPRVSHLFSALKLDPGHHEALAGLEAGLARGELEPTDLAPLWVEYLRVKPEGPRHKQRRMALARAYADSGQLDDAIYCLQAEPLRDDPDAQAMLLELGGAVPNEGADFEQLDLTEHVAEEPSPGPGATGSIAPPPAPTPASDPPQTTASRMTPDKRPTKRPPPPSARPAAYAAPLPEIHSASASLPTEQGQDTVVTPEPQAPMMPPPMPEAADAQPPFESAPPAPLPLRATTKPPESAASSVPGRATAGASSTPPAANPSQHPPQPQRPSQPAQSNTLAPRPRSGPVPYEVPAWTAPPAASQEELQALRQALKEATRHRRAAEGVDAAERILATDATDKDAFNYLDSYLRKTRDHRTRCALLEMTAASEALPPETRVLRLRESAGLRESRLKEIDNAIALWKLLGKLDPDSDEPIRNLKRLGDRIKRWEGLEQSLEEELASAADDGHRRDVLKRLCTLHTEQRANPEAAADALRRLLQLGPDADAEARLEQTLLLLGEYGEAAGLMRKRADASQSQSDRARVLLQLAVVSRDKLGDLPSAYAVYEEALPLLEQPTEVLEALAGIDAALGRYARLLDVLVRLRAVQSSDAAIGTTLQMADVAEHSLGDMDRAADILTQAADAHPQNEALITQLLDTLERAGRYEDLVETLREQAVLEKSRRRRAALMRRTAHILERHLGDEAGAVAVMESLLREEEDPEALRYLEDRARRSEDLSALVELLERRLKVSHGTEDEYAIRMERAQLLVHSLQRPAEALEDLTHLLDRVVPGDAAALALLDPACRAANRHDVLARVLERTVQLSDDPEHGVKLARTLADLYETELPSRRKAISALLRWAELAPSSVEPRRRLRPLQHAQRDHQGLLHTLDALAELESELDARLEATVAAAQLCAGSLGDAEGAWTRLQTPASQGVESAVEALHSLAQNLGRMDDYCDFLQASGQTDRLFAVLDSEVESAEDAAASAHWLRRSARAYLECSDNRTAAESRYGRLLALGEDEEALRFLLEQARAREELAAVAEFLGRLAALSHDPGERDQMRAEQAALLMDPLGRPAEAATCYRQLLQDGHSEDAELGLVAALREARLFGELVPVLEQRLQRAAATEARIELAREIATLYQDALERPSAAVPALREWHQADPLDPAPLRALDRLLTGEAQRQERLQVLDRLAALEPTEEAKARATLSASRMLRLELQDPDGALQRIAPFAAAAMPEVDAELTALADVSEAHFERICGLYAEAARDDAQVQLIERRLGRSDASAPQLELHRRAARLLSGRLDLPAEAERHYRAILDHVEDEEALRFQRAQAMQADDPRALSDYLGRLAAVTTDVRARGDLRFEQAHIVRARLSDPLRAASILREVVAESPDFAAALDELSAAAEDAGDDATLAESLERLLHIEQDAGQRAELGERLFRVCRDGLQDVQRGRAGLLAWREARPDALPPLRELRALYDESTEASALREVLDRLTALEPDDEARQEAQLAAGKLSAQVPLEDLDGAFERLWPLANAGHAVAAQTLLEIARTAGALSRLSEQYAEAGHYEEVARLLQEQAENASDADERANLYARCAELFAGTLGDELAAAEAYRELLTVREDLTALRYLADLARRFDEPETLLPLLRRLAAQTDDVEERAGALVEQARLLYDAMGDTPGAIAALRQLIAVGPGAPGAIEELITICEAERDFEGLSEGLWAQLDLQQDRLKRVDTAKRLAELHEEGGELPDRPRLIKALEAWVAADPSDAEPYSALVPLLDPEQHTERLAHALDVLSRNSADPLERNDATCRLARLQVEKLGDVDGALGRLSPLFLERDPEGESLLRELCLAHDRADALAAMHVRRAQASGDRASVARDWAAAATLYEDPLGQPKEALEAAMRRLGTDTADAAALDEVERLALQQHAAPRLVRVYGKLAEECALPQQRLELALRASSFFERAGLLEAASEWALSAFRLDPTHEGTMAQAESLAEKAGNHEQRLWLCEQRAERATEPGERLRGLLQASLIAGTAINDDEQAIQILVRALALAQHDAALCDEVFATARALDARHEDTGTRDTTRRLLQEQIRLASGAEDPAVAEAAYLLTARRMTTDLEDRAAAYDALKRGSTTLPQSEALMNALEQAATDLGRLDGLDAHLARLSDQQGDAERRASLLIRRGQLLSERLQRFDSAARVYGKLLELRPEDPEARSLHDEALRKAGRFQELVRALERRAQQAQNAAEQAAILCEQAQVWENDLRNRARATSALEEALRLDPECGTARETLERLEGA